MQSSFIMSPLSQFEVLSLIGFNAPIFNYLNLNYYLNEFYYIIYDKSFFI